MAATIVSLGARVLRRLGVAIVAASDRPASAATITPAALATRALQRLGVIAADELPAALDQDTALQAVFSVHEALNAQGTVDWIADAIPLGLANDYAMLTALHLASTFGKQVADAEAADKIEARVRRVALLRRAPSVAEQAVLDVHVMLDAAGKIRWSAFDIPDYAEAPYVALAANLCAPQFDRPLDPAADVWAMRKLAGVVALPPSGDPVRVEYF